MEAAASGDALMLERRYDDAVEAFTRAIKECPSSPAYHLQRAIAQHKIKDYIAAQADSERAIVLALARGNKSVRATAQFRRGLALYCMGRLPDALYCLKIAQRDDCQDKTLDIWLAKLVAACKAYRYKRLTIQDMAPNTNPVSEIPEAPEIDTASSLNNLSGLYKPVEAQPEELRTSGGNIDKHANIKHEWYETLDSVVISIYIKGLNKGECHVEFAHDNICVSLSRADNSATICKRFDPLFGDIKSAESSYRVMSTKVEISVKKAQPGKWSKLLKDRYVSRKEHESTPIVRNRKDWDHLTDYDEEQPADDGDAALTNLFQTLYKDADEDTRKAMVKSYTESGGTSLSTDWNSVKKQRVEVQPPEGMKACKFE